MRLGSIAVLSCALTLSALPPTRLVAAGLPGPFEQRIRFLAQNSGSAAIVGAVDVLLGTSFFPDALEQWRLHGEAMKATSPSARPWAKGLDVKLTLFVDPYERGLTVDVYKVVGPLSVTLHDGRSLSAFVVNGAVWDPMGDSTPRSFALEVVGDEVTAIHSSFTLTDEAPPEATESPSVALMKRLQGLQAAAAPEVAAAIDVVIHGAPGTTDSFVAQVAAAWEQFQPGAADDPYAHLWAHLPTKVYWAWVDAHEPMVEVSPAVGRVFDVEVESVRGPVTLVGWWGRSKGFIATVSVRYLPEWQARGKNDVTTDVAVIVFNNVVSRVAFDFEEVHQ